MLIPNPYTSFGLANLVPYKALFLNLKVSRYEEEHFVRRHVFIVQVVPPRNMLLNQKIRQLEQHIPSYISKKVETLQEV